MDVDGPGLGVGKGERLKAILARKCDVMRPEKSTDSISQAPYLFSVNTEQACQSMLSKNKKSIKIIVVSWCTKQSSVFTVNKCGYLSSLCHPNNSVLRQELMFSCLSDEM